MNSEERREEWLAKHISDPPVSFGFEGKTEAQNKRAKEVLVEFLKDHPPGTEALVAQAVLGETEHAHLFVKEVVRPKPGEQFGERLTFYGVDYFLRGNPTQRSVFGLELAKSNLFQLPKRVLKIPFYFVATALHYILARKSFYKLLYWELKEIHWKVTRHSDPPSYNETGRELKRAVHNALLEVFGIDNERAYYPFKSPRFHKTKAYPDSDDLTSNHFGWCVALFSRFVITFLELDFAYRFRIQDALGQLNQKNLGTKEIMRILGILMERETKFHSTRNRSSGGANVLKWRMIYAILRLAFFFEPKAQQYVVHILVNLDLNKIRMDENDWYFCLGWTSYDFGGKTYEERMKIREELDLKNNHVFWALWNRVK